MTRNCYYRRIPMKKIVLLCASPRKNGNSNALADAFEAKLKDKAEIVRYDTQNMNFLGCRACDNCFQDGKPCCFSDDFNLVMEEILTADAIVIATGVYWYTFPSGLKALIDKFYSLCVAGKDLRGKKVALMATCEDDTDEAFHGMCFAFDSSFELLHAECVGKVLVHGVHKLGDIRKTDGEQRAEKLADTLYRKLSDAS